MDTIHNTEGCFFRALDDEPVFVLLARDPVAAETVRWWVTLRQALIGAGQKPLEDHGALAEALETAQAMVAWRSEATGPLWPDGPRWKHEASLPTRYVMVSREAIDEDDTRMGKLEARLGLDLEQFMFYCQQHVDKGTPDGDAKARVNYEHACEIASLLQQPKPEFPKPTLQLDAAQSATLDEEIISTLNRKPEIRDRVRRALREPFVAVDLAAKMATGLRQVTADMEEWLGDKTGTERAASYKTFMDRINGYAAELEQGRITQERLRSRTIGKSPLLGEPYTPSDTIDVTDTPALPPHRFTIFTKGRQWAYGRGLEISPSHIPAMLDAMEKDGWVLHSVFGGTVADKVGMLFRRSPRLRLIVSDEVDSPDWRDIGKGWSKNQDTPEGAPWSKPRGMEPSRVYVGRWFGRDLWLDGNVTSQALQQLKDRIMAGESMVGMGRGQEP